MTKGINMNVVRQWSIIKHENNMDVAFEVVSSENKPSANNYVISGRWINIGYTEDGGWYCTGRLDTLTISKPDMEKWLIMVDEAPVMRDSKWRYLKNRLWG